MNSQEIGKYITATDGVSKPWLLLQLRLQKLPGKLGPKPRPLRTAFFVVVIF